MALFSFKLHTTFFNIWLAILRDIVMIRLPLTSITIGPGDLKEFELRQDRPRAAGKKGIQPEFLQVEGTQDISSFWRLQRHPKGDVEDPCGSGYHPKKLPVEMKRMSSFTQNMASGSIDELRSPESPGSPGSPVSPEKFTKVEEGSPPATYLSQDVYGYISIGIKTSPKSNTFKTQQQTSPLKDDFHYSGFVECPAEHIVVNTPKRSSPFVPDDFSTPEYLQPIGTQGLRSRTILPRSPLFHSHNAPSSPELLLTSSLTPRVVSSVATHNTPGIIFARPPRRPPGRPASAFRHQSNSFSFDESERASVAYEQDRLSSSSTSASVPRPSNSRNLHEELRGSSLQSSRVTSGVPSSPPCLNEEYQPESVLADDCETADARGRSRPSSPHLPLPRPFSTVPRRVSRVESLPSTTTGEYMLRHSHTSPAGSSSASPFRTGMEARPLSLMVTPSTVGERGDEVVSSSYPCSRNSPRSFLRAASRLIASYRARSPLSRHGSSSHPSFISTPLRKSLHRRAVRDTSPVPTRTLSRSYHVYEDALSPTTQPQTPAHLPEARHQSRFHPAYTAPIAIRAARAGALSFNNGDGAGRDPSAPNTRVSIATPSRRRMARSDSPLGLMDEGFWGLYGGRENGDEEQSWADGVRFSNAEVRLWGLREARREARSLSETPEPGDWRVRRL